MQDQFIWWKYPPYKLFLLARVLTTLAFQAAAIAGPASFVPFNAVQERIAQSA